MKTGFAAIAISAFLAASLVCTSQAAQAGLAGHLLDRFRGSSKPPENEKVVTFGDREIIIYVPHTLQPVNKRSMIIVLHGGGGNANRIVSEQSEKGMKFDDLADKYGFVVAYLNGTRVARIIGEDKKGWNAGNCCGLPSDNNVDDVAYISDAVKYLTDHYAVDPHRVYAVGHSNGAMMAMRMVCETDVFAAIVPVSGAIGIDGDCAHAGDKYILAIRGDKDMNVPYEGGVGKGPSKTSFTSQEYTRHIFENAGAKYELQVVPNAEHKLDTINDGIKKLEGVTLAEKAVAFFGLTKQP